MMVEHVPLSSSTSDKVRTSVEVECIVDVERETLRSRVAASQGIESVGVKVEDFRNVDGFVEQLNAHNIGYAHKSFCEKLKNCDGLLHIAGGGKEICLPVGYPRVVLP
jgi:hypothetical protein